MATHGNHRTTNDRLPPLEVDGKRAARGSFPGTNGDEWHRALTGRQAPEPITNKLRSIYGKILSEQLPDNMVDLLSQLGGADTEQKQK